MKDETGKNEKMDAFHAHLDVCKQCREHPFELCAEGRKRLLKFAETVVAVRKAS